MESTEQNMLLKMLLVAFLLLIFIIVGIAGATLHEGTHYIVARLWTSNHRISSSMTHIPIPDMVNFERPFDIPNYGVRAAGIAPVIWVPMFIFTGLNFIQTATIQSALVMTFFFGGSVISPADILAFTSPTEWKRMTAADETYGHVTVLLVLLGLKDGPWRSLPAANP